MPQFPVTFVAQLFARLKAEKPEFFAKVQAILFFLASLVASAALYEGYLVYAKKPVPEWLTWFISVVGGLAIAAGVKVPDLAVKSASPPLLTATEAKASSTEELYRFVEAQHQLIQSLQAKLNQDGEAKPKQADTLPTKPQSL